MRLLLTLLMLAPAALPQTAIEVFRKAPPAVDAELRDRISKFYQTYIDKKFRLSDQYVAEESKDRYFAAQKAPYFSYQISEIKYEANYTKAIVLGLAEQDRMIAMGGVVRMKVPMRSDWKLVDGKWMWYLPERNCVATPMGCGAVADAEAEVTEKQKKEIEARITNPNLAEMTGAFGFAESSVPLVLTPGVPQVTRDFENRLNGYLVPKIRVVKDPDVEAAFEPAQLPPLTNGKLVIKMKAGGSFAPRRVMIEVEVFGKVIPFAVAIEGPAAKKK